MKIVTNNAQYQVGMCVCVVYKVCVFGCVYVYMCNHVVLFQWFLCFSASVPFVGVCMCLVSFLCLCGVWFAVYIGFALVYQATMHCTRFSYALFVCYV